MKGHLSFAALLVITVCADRDPFKCDKDGKCAPGLRCDHGTCVLRTDCPMLSMPRMKSGCIMLTTVDERGCPMPKIVCSKENLKCGSIYCEPGYECDHDRTVCIPRRDCPNIALPKKEGCTDKMALDEYDCLVPVRNCKSPKPLRTKRQETASTKKQNNVTCPKNAEYRECTDICPPKSCANFDMISPCFSLRCGGPKCVCKEGHVQLSGNIEQGCVRREICVKMKSMQKNVNQTRPDSQTQVIKPTNLTQLPKTPADP